MLNLNYSHLVNEMSTSSINATIANQNIRQTIVKSLPATKRCLRVFSLSQACFISSLAFDVFYFDLHTLSSIRVKVTPC